MNDETGEAVRQWRIKAQSKRGAFDRSWSDSARTDAGRSGLLK